MAFSKIEGFEVTPVTPSCSMRALNSPLSINLRPNWSSQTAWPHSPSCFSLFIDVLLASVLSLWRSSGDTKLVFLAVRSRADLPGISAGRRLVYRRGPSAKLSPRDLYLRARKPLRQNRKLLRSDFRHPP